MFNNIMSNGLILCGLLISANAQFMNCPCTTPAPDSFQGRCVSIPDCKIISDILKLQPKNIPPRVQQFLEKAECGIFNGQKYICCENHYVNRNLDCRLFTTTTTTTTTTTIKPTDNGTNLMSVEEDDTSIVTCTDISTDIDIDSHPNQNLLPSDCGSAFVDKISNANLTELFEFPFMALLQYESTEGLRFLCGGTLISPLYVLTAAHCVVGRDGRQLRFVRLGEHNYNTERECDIDDPEYCADPVQDIPVEEIIPHVCFNSTLKTNDIALIRLRYPANITVNNVKPICLPTTSTLRDKSFQIAIIAGWGTTENGTTSSILLKANIPVIERNICHYIYKSAGITIDASHICAGGENGVDTCRGDSGGPLFYSGQVPKQKTPRYIQYGVVSAGPPCNLSDGPSLYSNVSYFMKWILDNLKK